MKNLTRAQRIALGKQQIISDAHHDVFPVGVICRFPNLHDFVDANFYGFTRAEAESSASLLALLPGKTEAEGVEELNAIQDALDVWIADGGLSTGVEFAAVYELMTTW